MHHSPWSSLWSEVASGGTGLVRWSDAPRSVPAQGWDRPADRGDRQLLLGIRGPALDVGCGPGRLSAELAAAGVAVLGVDIAADAVAITRRRDAVALRACVFDGLPAEGLWADAVLADGNIGIGGDPVRLLRRIATLLEPGGRIHVELDPPRGGPGAVTLYLEDGTGVPAVVPWARLRPQQLAEVAAAADLQVLAAWRFRRRWFARLLRS